MTSCYEFVLRGSLSPDALPALAGFDRVTEDGSVVLRGTLPPECTLSDVLGQFEALGLGLHSFHQFTEPSPRDAVGP